MPRTEVQCSTTTMALEPLMYEEKNLLILIAVLGLCLWFANICRRIFCVHELCDAVSSGAVVRLGNGETSFGELRLLWSTSMQQQLLRSSRKCRGANVSQVVVPWSFLPNSIRSSDSRVQDDGTHELGISFTYTATARCNLQLLWGMEHGAMERLMVRVNRQQERRGEKQKTMSFLATRRKRCGWFGARYTAVDSRDTVGIGTEMNRLERASEEGNVCASMDALFPASEYCGMSEASEVAPGRDCVLEVRFPLTPHRGDAPVGDPSAVRREAELPGIGTGGGKKMYQRRDSWGVCEGEEVDGGAGADSSEKGIIAGRLQHAHGTGDPPGLPSPAARTTNAMPDAMPLVMVVSVQEEIGQDRCSRGRAEHVHHVVFALGARAPTGSHFDVEQSIVITNRAAYLTKEVYGQPQKGGEEDECIICLSETKVITLLPCRHLCICARCLSRLDQCPVCRCAFGGYLDASRAEAGDSERRAAHAQMDRAPAVSREGEALCEPRGPRTANSPAAPAARHPWACLAEAGAGRHDV